MKYDKKKILFMLGAFCIIVGIIIAKVSAMMGNETNNNTFTILGILMIALGAIFISINIIMRLIEHSKSLK